MKVWRVAAVVSWLAVCGGAMTVTQGEEGELPPELKPIVPGGSWFDDRALERLRSRHQHIKEIGGPTNEEDPEEMFIMAKLRDPEIRILKPEPDVREQLGKGELKTQDTREALRSFMRQHKERRGGTSAGDASDTPMGTSKEFMEIYERELQKFFKNFMSVMLQAEIGGVSIENRSEEKEGLTAGQDTHAENNAVSKP